MLEKVIDSIVEAEKAGEEKVAEAQRRSETILSESERNVAGIRERAAAERKERLKEMYAGAEKTANEKAREVREKGFAESDALKAGYMKKTEKAVDMLLRRVL